MAPARTHLKIAVALTLLYTSVSTPALAQADWLCRVHWEEQTYGGDTLATTAVIQIENAAPQTDGSIYYMGYGAADIVFTPGTWGCTASSGGNVSMNMMAIVSSEDGQTATVDIGPSLTADDTFTVGVSCRYGHNSEIDVGASTPPAVTLPLRDGASASYDESSRSSFGSVGGQRGTVRLEYCRPS